MSKILNYDDLMILMNKLIDKIQTDIFKANASGELENFIIKLGYKSISNDILPSYNYLNFERSKILVLAHNLDKTILLQAAKELGIESDRLDLVEYKSNFDFKTLKRSVKYSDILIGPIPHKVKNMGDASSFLAEYEINPKDYPMVQRIETLARNLKITKTAFVNCLLNSQYYENVILRKY